MGMIFSDDTYEDRQCYSCEYKTKNITTEIGSLNNEIKRLNNEIKRLNKIIRILQSEYIDMRSQFLWKTRYSSDYVICCDRARQDYDKIVKEVEKIN